MDAIIKSSFWSDTRVEDQPPEIKLACLWLVTNSGRDLCGFTKVSSKRFTFETGLTPSALEGACKGLPSSFEMLPGGVFFVVHFLRHQFGKGGQLSLGNKVVIAAARHGARLPMTLGNRFFEAYPELQEIGLKHILKNQTFPSPIDTPSEKSEGVREGEGEGEGEGVREGCGESGKLDLVSIVDAYPRRQDQAAALEALRVSIRKGANPEVVLAGTRAIAAVIQQLPSGALNAFVVSAATFFRNERWRDDPQTWVRSGAAKNGAQAGKLNLGGRKPAVWVEA